jgi:LysM repeat protein
MRINPAKFTMLMVCALISFSNLFAQKSRIVSYVEQYKSLAIEEMIRTGIPASITLAQGLLETGFGQSELAVNANNHFGIKCKSDWTGEKVYHDDDAKGECFRKYNTAIESYRDHSDFLRNRPHYAPLFKLDITDYEGWAKGLKAAGYATNPQYPQRLIKLIEENNLHQYTLLALKQKKRGNLDSEALASVNNTASEVEVKATEEETPSQPASAPEESIQFASAVSTDEVKNNYPAGIFSINESKVVFAEAGTSLFALATNNNIAYNKLLEFNDLSKVDIISKSQLIFLQKKQKRGSKDVHVVEPNENLHDICQKEGLQLSSVLEFNNISKDVTPAVGQKIYLKAQSPISLKNVGNNSRTQTLAALR